MSNNPKTRSGARLVGLATAAVVSLSALTLLPGTASAAPTAASAASTADNWEKYVLGPDSPQVYPTAFADPRGDGDPRQQRWSSATASMTLTTAAGQTPASVVLDFGKEMSGVPFMDVVRTVPAAAGGPNPTLQVVTGEARSFLRRAAATTISANTPAGATHHPRLLDRQPRGQQRDRHRHVAPPRRPARSSPSLRTPARARERARSPLDTPLTDAGHRAPCRHPDGNPAVPGTAVTSAALGPASDENPGQSLVGGNDLLTPTGPGRARGRRPPRLPVRAPDAHHPGHADDPQPRGRLPGLPRHRQGLQGLLRVQRRRAQPALVRRRLHAADEPEAPRPARPARRAHLRRRQARRQHLDRRPHHPGPDRHQPPWATWASSTSSRRSRSCCASSAPDGHIPGSPDFNKGRAAGPAYPGGPSYAVGQGSPLYYSVNYSGYGARSIIDYYRYSGDDAFAQQTPGPGREGRRLQRRLPRQDQEPDRAAQPVEPERPQLHPRRPRLLPVLPARLLHEVQHRLLHPAARDGLVRAPGRHRREGRRATTRPPTTSRRRSPPPCGTSRRASSA